MTTATELFLRIAQLIVVQPNGCWTVGEPNRHGNYAAIQVDGVDVQVHRLMYRLCVGPIPPGHLIDHDCHNEDLTCPGGPPCWHRRCCNPLHLRAVPRATNSITNRRHLRGKRRPPRTTGRDLRPFIATRELAQRLGRVHPDAEVWEIEQAAINLGRELAHTYPMLRSIQQTTGHRRRGYIVETLPAEVARMARLGTEQHQTALPMDR